MTRRSGNVIDFGASTSTPVALSQTSNGNEAIALHIMFRARATAGTLIASSRVAVIVPLKGTIKESMVGSGNAAATSLVDGAIAFARKLSNKPMRAFSQPLLL